MTNSELIESVLAQSPNFSKRDITLIVETVFESMSAALAGRERIEIRGFGSFASRQRKARNGRNPRTGASVQVPEKWVPVFAAGKGLRERLNESASK